MREEWSCEQPGTWCRRADEDGGYDEMGLPGHSLARRPGWQREHHTVAQPATETTWHAGPPDSRTPISLTLPWLLLAVVACSDNHLDFPLLPSNPVTFASHHLATLPIIPPRQAPRTAPHTPAAI